MFPDPTPFQIIDKIVEKLKRGRDGDDPLKSYPLVRLEKFDKIPAMCYTLATKSLRLPEREWILARVPAQPKTFW